MAKSFNYMKRSAELFSQGVCVEEAAKILAKEQDEADCVVLDDGKWFEEIDEMIDGAEADYQAFLKSQQD